MDVKIFRLEWRPPTHPSVADQLNKNEKQILTFFTLVAKNILVQICSDFNRATSTQCVPNRKRLAVLKADPTERDSLDQRDLLPPAREAIFAQRQIGTGGLVGVWS